MVKLYVPYGNLKTFRGAGPVTLHWFVKDRERPIGAYPELIERFAQLSPEVQARSKLMVDELFTQEEFFAFRTYMYEKHGEDLRTEVLVPPINGAKPENAQNRKLVRPLGLCREGEEGGFCQLSDEPDYSLPFAVWGYHTGVNWPFHRKL